MAISTYYDATGSATVYATANQGGLTVMYKFIDVPAILAADAGTSLASASKITAGEGVIAFTLPIGFVVGGVVTYIKTAGTAGGTIDIGSVASEQIYDAAVSTATADAWAMTATDAGSMEAANGTLISSRASVADTVAIQFNADETVGSFVVAVWGIDFSNCLNF
jgi:hypothetical protein